MKDVVVLGGGINGLLAAYYASQAGHRVTIVEKEAFQDGCSHGNAGMIVPSHIIPLAQPGMISQGLKWMLSPTSPFYVKPRLSWDLAKWGYLFWKHATEDHVARAIPALRDISLLSKRLYQALAQEAPFDFGWEEKGLLMLFKNEHSLHEMDEEARVANRAGIEAQLLNGAEVQQLEPDVRVSVAGGVYYPGDAHLYPNLLIQGLTRYLSTASNVKLLDRQEVLDFKKQAHKITHVVTTDHTLDCNEVVLATGAWSPWLTQKLGLSLSLQGGKGYSFMQKIAPAAIRVPAIMLEARATATAMGDSVRFAGTLEVAGTDLSVNMNRVKGIANSISNYYPDLKIELPEVEKVWSGLRPCSPDGLPYIGRLPQYPNCIVATGHGMMGLSLGAATGKLIAELLSEQPTSMPLDAFRPERFS